MFGTSVLRLCHPCYSIAIGLGWPRSLFYNHLFIQIPNGLLVSAAAQIVPKAGGYLLKFGWFTKRLGQSLDTNVLALFLGIGST